jgi:hypothetical protein
MLRILKGLSSGDVDPDEAAAMRATLIPLLLPLAALAQSGSPPDPAAAPAPAAAATADKVLLDDREPAPIPEKILEPPPPEAEAAVSIRTDSSGDVVEEYRTNGRLYMVKVRPEKGIPYTLQDTNGDGRLDARDGEGPVRPVYYTLYEWN